MVTCLERGADLHVAEYYKIHTLHSVVSTSEVTTLWCYTNLFIIIITIKTNHLNVRS